MVSDSIPAGDDLALASAAGCDERASRAVVERLLDRVRATVHYLVAGSSDADDLVQLSLVEILRSIDSFQGRSRLETWADRVTVRTVMRELKRRQRQERPLVRDSGAGLAPEDRAQEVLRQDGAQEREALRGQLRRRLALKLQRLSPPRRAVVVLRYVHGYSIREISRITDAPPNTVRDRLQVGKRLLRGFILRDPVLRDWAEMMDT